MHLLESARTCWCLKTAITSNLIDPTHKAYLQLLLTDLCLFNDGDLDSFMVWLLRYWLLRLMQEYAVLVRLCCLRKFVAK
jgi:hypothetical protein